MEASWFTVYRKMRQFIQDGRPLPLFLIIDAVKGIDDLRNTIDSQRGLIAELVTALEEMLQLRDFSLCGTLTSRHEMDIVRDARAALAKAKEVGG